MTEIKEVENQNHLETLYRFYTKKTLISQVSGSFSEVIKKNNNNLCCFIKKNHPATQCNTSFHS